MIFCAHRVIHLSDYAHATKSENLVPGEGDHGDELRELLQEVKHSATTLVLEVSPKPNAAAAIPKTLAFIDTS